MLASSFLIVSTISTASIAMVQFDPEIQANHDHIQLMEQLPTHASYIWLNEPQNQATYQAALLPTGSLNIFLPASPFGTATEKLAGFKAGLEALRLA